MTKVYFKKIDEYNLGVLKEYVRNCFSELGVDFKKGSSVLVKPNFLLAKNADSPVITNPVLIRAVLEVLLEMKTKPFIYEIIKFFKARARRRGAFVDYGKHQSKV